MRREERKLVTMTTTTAPGAFPDPDDPEDEVPFPEAQEVMTMECAVPYRQVLLGFREDDHALLFRSWLEGDGWAAFGAWLGARPACRHAKARSYDDKEISNPKEAGNGASAP